MRILYISFGYRPYWSGGMVRNQIGLMKNLQAMGHQLSYFTACRYDLRNKPYLRSRKIEGLTAIELVNSPNLYDPYCYRTNPESHCSDVAVETLTEKVVNSVRPDIVHISDMRMQCASIIALIRRRGIPVVKTFHNYWDLCPKSDLLFDDKELCSDIANGAKCLICLSRYESGGIPFMHRVKGSIPYEYLFPLVSRLGGLKKAMGRRRDSDCKPVDFSAKAYLNRRNYFIDMLNSCSAIHTTSRSVGKLIHGYGIDVRRVNVISLSAEGLSEIAAKPDHTGKLPITFGYRGRLHSRKGINVLLDAFSHLDQGKCRLLVYGDGNRNIMGPFLNCGLNIEYRGSYVPEEVNDKLEEIDVGIVPSIWEEIFGIVGLEYLNARIPVIASNIGGISEWLKEGRNGYLFPPGNTGALTKAMNKFIEEPKLVLHLQRRMNPWKSVRTYAAEISQLYEKVLNGT
ncbi:MAG: glycosyltransferase [candidate division WOR-3 bacterium]|nr:MAG: glycosyltransferase [candidate division WOR-3 bacterium]